MIRVLYVHNSADIYGASRSLMRLLGKLDRSRFQPMVVMPQTGLLHDILKKLDVEVVLHPRLSIITRQTYGSWRMIAFALDLPLSVLFLWRLIRRHRINVVHTNTGVIVSPALAAWLARVPHVWHIRDWFQEFGGAWKPYSRYITMFSARVIAIAEAVAQQFAGRRKVLVLHNGFDLGEFQVPREKLRAEFRQRMGFGDDFVVGCVGRIKFVRKGQEHLVKAMGILKQRGIHARCLIVGSAAPGSESHLDQLKDMIRDLGVEDSVVFAGEMADTRPAYAAMDALVMPSAQPEPLGGVILEAMALSVPVIATNIGGPLEIITDGENGFLVPPAAPESIAACIQTLTHDAGLRKRMGASGPETLRQRFMLADKVREIERLYTELVEVT